MDDVIAEPAPPTAAATVPPLVFGLVPPGQHVVAGAIAGLIAAATAAICDGIWSWGALSQFVPSAGGRIRFLLYLATIYGLCGFALGAAVVAVLMLFLRVTRLGTLYRFALAEHARARARDPRDALIGLSLVLAWVPLAAVALGLGWALLTHGLDGRKHHGLVIVIAMAGAVAALLISALAALIVARVFEVVLRRLAVGRWARPLSSTAAPALAAALLTVIAVAGYVRYGWETAAVLPLRPVGVAMLAFVIVGPGAWIGTRVAARWWRFPRGARSGSAAGVPLLVFGLALLAGGSPAVIKAAVTYSGAGDLITQALKSLLDLDRDGHAAVLGGDDCEDLDAEIHPGAVDIPDDGIDQNCVAGDAKSRRSIEDIGFAPVPVAVPTDLNIVLITIDTLRADHVGAYGYSRPTTSSLDALAAQGALFTSSWAHAPSTRYSIPAILTGRLPLQVHYNTAVSGWPGLLAKATTIAEVVKARGLATGAITNYWYFDAARAMNQGFDVYDNSNAALHTGSDPAHTTGTSSRQQTDKAIEFVAKHQANRFFLWVHYYDPHHTYQRHPEVGSFGPDEIDRYDDEIRFTDLHVGRLLDDLRGRGLWDKTAVIVTGDHGEGFGEHGIQLHGYDLYAAQTRVPLIIRVPGLSPRRIATAAGHIDLMPTIANLIGATASTEMMGSSLVSWLVGANDDLERAVFQQVSYEGHHEKRGAATARCHVLYSVSPHTSWEIYRVDVDPAETRDRSTAPGECSSARRTFERWYDASQIPAGAAEALLPARPEIARPLDLDFGGEVRLLALEAPATVRAGETVDLTWTFESRGRLRGDWWVFAHVEGPGRFTADHSPVRPFGWWNRGEFIRYTVAVTVPPATPPGTYTIWSGLFLARKGTRQPVRAPPAVRVVDNRAAVATLEVVR